MRNKSLDQQSILEEYNKFKLNYKEQSETTNEEESLTVLKS